MTLNLGTCRMLVSHCLAAVVGVLVLTATASSAPIKNTAGLTTVRFWESTGPFVAYDFAPVGAMTTYLGVGTLSPSNNDFAPLFDENYDVFYSDAAGNFDPNGDCVSIEAVFPNSLPAGGGLNLGAVDLLFSNGSILRADTLKSWVGLGNNYIVGSEVLAVDADTPIPSTDTTMGSTTLPPTQHLRITVGWSQLIPEPSTFVILATGLGLTLIGRRQFRFSPSPKAIAAVISTSALLSMSSGSFANVIVNGSFEVPPFSGTSVSLVNETLVPGWETTASDNLIEIWSNGFNSVVSAAGAQHAELNANFVSTLFQDVTGIASNSTVGYSFAHRGRLGPDTLELRISDLGTDNAPGGAGTAADTLLFNQQFSTGNTAWVQYSSPNIGPLTLGNDMRFEFVSIAATGGNQAIGNFLDNVKFGIGVPEPGTIALSVVGLLGCTFRTRWASET